MIRQVFLDNLFAYLIGNIIGFIKSILKTERPIWISKFYFKYRRFREYSFIIIWTLLAFGFGFLTSNINLSDSFFPTGIGALFLITGYLLLTGFLTYFDELYIFNDRIERRFFFFVREKIPFENVIMVLRDKKTLNHVDVIYKHPVYGYSSLGSNRHSPWNIPANVFTKKTLLPKKKLHINLYQNFEEIKNDLPDFPILHQTGWVNAVFKDRLMALVFAAFNPYTTTIALTLFCEATHSKSIFYILIELSRAYCRAYLKYFSSKSVSVNYNSFTPIS